MIFSVNYLLLILLLPCNDSAAVFRSFFSVKAIRTHFTRIDSDRCNQIIQTVETKSRKILDLPNLFYPKPGTVIDFGDGLLTGTVLETVDDGNRLIQFSYEGIFEEILDQLGQMPLPPYITHQLKDKNRYQTVYAVHEGSAAAPTAGLHFTKELLKQIEDMGVKIAHVTLHVGLGTFRPVKVENVLDHHMHSEFYVVEESEAKKVNDTKAAGGRVICVGTTSCRTVESASTEDGILQAKTGWTDIFIYPGYRFKILDALITNFHLPESTLVMLVSALAGREHILNAYEEAIRERYRFFSFGDAMFIVNGQE